MQPDIRTRVVGVMLAQTFGDIGASAFFGDIAWLYSQAISNGCAPGVFCPGLMMTRAEMASFLSRAQAAALYGRPLLGRITDPSTRQTSTGSPTPGSRSAARRVSIAPAVQRPASGWPPSSIAP
ncbi:MAG: S-layer homology domain-containing protein [Chloroflexi bacterium]|nr:S-layer homology domain-containing protein [Chloroflexota bacterium]